MIFHSGSKRMESADCYPSIFSYCSANYFSWCDGESKARYQYLIDIFKLTLTLSDGSMPSIATPKETSLYAGYLISPLSMNSSKFRNRRYWLVLGWMSWLQKILSRSLICLETRARHKLLRGYGFPGLLHLEHRCLEGYVISINH